MVCVGGWDLGWEIGESVDFCRVFTIFGTIWIFLVGLLGKWEF